MTRQDNIEKDYFDRAFELAYFIHATKEIAFFIAEDALDSLASTLGHQKKNRKPAERLRGFLKSGERARPIRKTMTLSEAQTLQWLVYRHSESWERQTEQGEEFYLPTEEDLIVRYIKQLVFTSLRSGSFYVTLAAGSLLHQYDRRETRLFYDILTQYDSARMKDTNYIGKQRLDLLEKVSRRFDQMIQTVNRTGEEKQFVMRPTTEWVINLVNESLRRFTPWDTSCVIASGFDVTDIPEFYFSDASPSDEEAIEINRIHTVLDPECFARFTRGLAKYVRVLPPEDQDKVCNYDSQNERLVVPQFSDFPSGGPRGDRFHSPTLTTEDYLRLQRTLDARAHRKKSFSPQHLCVYVDDVLSVEVNSPSTNRLECLVGTEASIIEVRGRDAFGELTLATLIIDPEYFSGEIFEDFVVKLGGQKIAIRLMPVKDNGSSDRVRLQVSYREPHFTKRLLSVARRAGLPVLNLSKSQDPDAPSRFQPSFSWATKRILAAALVVAAVVLIWSYLSPRRSPLEVIRQPQAIPSPSQGTVEKTPVASSTPPPVVRPSRRGAEGRLIARAAWSDDRQAALRALSIESTRSETQTIDLLPRETRVILSVPIYDDRGQTYTSYRVTLSAADTRVWQQTLRSPSLSPSGYAHILDLLLFTRRLPGTGPYDLKIEGGIQGSWWSLGKVRFNQKNQ